MSPTLFRYKNYRFFFFSREELRMHIHVKSPEGEAKIWMQPALELDRSVGYNQSEMSEIIEQVERHRDEIESRWRQHFS